MARSFVTLIVTRTFAGVFGGTLLNCLACFVADMWLTDAERDFWLTLFVLIYVGGVTLGPTFGALVAVLEWRWYVPFSIIRPVRCETTSVGGHSSVEPSPCIQDLLRPVNYLRRPLPSSPHHHQRDPRPSHSRSTR